MKVTCVRPHLLSLPLPRPVEASGHLLATVPNGLIVEQMEWRPGIGLGLNRKALGRFRV